jgi:predicted N-acyltransferase
MPDSSALQIELAEGVRSVPREEWNALVGDASPFLEWDWLASLEEAGCVGDDTGWSARPLLLRDAGRLVAACPTYTKDHSEGEFVFDWGWADAAERAGIRYYPKLLVGVPFTPATGARLLVSPERQNDAKELRGVLAGALREICTTNDLSSVHVNFCTEDELEPLGQEGFLTRVGIQYHWRNEGFENFEDYLARFRSKRRNQVRRERREVERQGVRVETLHGDGIPDSIFEPMYRFYLSTIRSRAWGRQYLNPRFFELVRERFRKRLVFVVAHADDEPIAGAFNVAKGDTLYGRYWGATRYVRNLHFEVCYYAGIEHCIERGLRSFEPGAGGEYKQLRGFDAVATYSAHYLADSRLRNAVGRFLEGERDDAGHTLEWMHENSALKPSEG